jgi:hypothetical protein
VPHLPGHQHRRPSRRRRRRRSLNTATLPPCSTAARPSAPRTGGSGRSHSLTHPQVGMSRLRARCALSDSLLPTRPSRIPPPAPPAEAALVPPERRELLLHRLDHRAGTEPDKTGRPSPASQGFAAPYNSLLVDPRPRPRSRARPRPRSRARPLVQHGSKLCPLQLAQQRPSRLTVS